VSSARTRRTAAASLTLLAALGLSACGTGFDAAVNAQYQAAVGADDRTGDIEVLNATVVADEAEQVTVEESEETEQTTGGTDTTEESAESEQPVAGDSGTIAASLVNNGEETRTLTSITAGTVDGEKVQVTGDARVKVARGQLVRIGVDAKTLFAATPIIAGYYVDLTFTFDDGSSVVLQTPIVSRGDDDEYDSIVETTERTAKVTDRTGNADDADGEETTARPE